MALLVASDYEDPDEWRRYLAGSESAIEVRFWPEVGAREDILMLALDTIPDGLFNGLVNLRCIQFLGHGVADALRHPALPAGVPVTRLKDPGIIRWVVEHAIGYILHQRRHMAAYENQQPTARWERHPVPDAGETCVAVLGLGSIGTRLARTLTAFEFRVLGWAQSDHAIDGVDCHAGSGALESVLAEADYVIAVLPGTAPMQDFFDADKFKAMKPGAYFINVGRGSVVDEEAIIGALDAGHIAGAQLDVFHIEPLPGASPLWRHPKVRITPHSAGGAATASFPDIVENYRRVAAGEAPLNIADPEKGY